MVSEAGKTCNMKTARVLPHMERYKGGGRHKGKGTGDEYQQKQARFEMPE